MRFAWIAAAGCGLHVTSMHGTAPDALEVARPFALVAQDRSTVTLAREPTVLVFYRGYW
jgi:hypothetical protein